MDVFLATDFGLICAVLFTNFVDWKFNSSSRSPRSRARFLMWQDKGTVAGRR